MKKAIVLYLHVHQPYRVRHYSIFDAGTNHDYFFAQHYEDQTNNERIVHKIAKKSYIPTNQFFRYHRYITDERIRFGIDSNTPRSISNP